MTLAAVMAALLLAHAPSPDDSLRHLDGVAIHAEVDEVARRHGADGAAVAVQLEEALRRAGVEIRSEEADAGHPAALVLTVDAIDGSTGGVHPLVAYSIRFGVRQYALLPDGSAAWVSIWSLDVLGQAPTDEFGRMFRESVDAVAGRFCSAYAAAHAPGESPAAPRRAAPGAAPDRAAEVRL